MGRNIRSVLWLESSFFHRACQANTYTARARPVPGVIRDKLHAAAGRAERDADCAQAAREIGRHSDSGLELRGPRRLVLTNLG